MPGMVPEYDHIKALVNGGEHRESNIQILCEICHLHKTGSDVAIKSKTYEKRLKHVGIKKKKRSGFSTNRDGKFKRKMDGTVVRR